MEISVLHEDCPNLSTMFIKQKYRVIDYRNFCIQAFTFIYFSFFNLYIHSLDIFISIHAWKCKKL